MKRIVLICSLTVLFISAFAIADDLPYKEGELFVRFADPAASTQTRNSILSSIFGYTCSYIIKEYTLVPGLTLIEVPSGMTLEQARILLAQSSTILYTGLNFKVHAAVIPNDNRFSELWGMHNTGQLGGTIDADIDAPEAWNYHKGSSSVVVADIDTGVDYTHPDLIANRWVNTGEIPGNGLDDDGNGYIDDVYGYDFVNEDSNPMDDYSHGTHVAGTIGAVGNNNMGVVGVCWTVKIMALKFLDASGGGTLGDAVDAIEYATAMGAKVINASWGGYTSEFPQELYETIEAAGDAGVIFVAAAHNYGLNNDIYPIYPASFDLDNIISVMATTNTDGVAYYSNYGLVSVDLGAPGGETQYENDPHGILSTLPGNQYGFKQGTSMACPHVAGACALLLSADPDLTYTDIKQILLNSTDPIPSLTGLCVTGGRLNLFNAVSEFMYDTIPPSPNPAEWEIDPQATGLHTIAMKVKAATDRSGVEYFFKCVTDANKNSAWQDSTLYERGDFDANTTYTFQVKYRDKSDNHNETGWSSAKSATTGGYPDTLPPFPNPSRWKIKPKVVKLQPPPRVRMEAVASTDEHGPVEYYFKCININPADPCHPDPNFFNSGWISSSIYTISSGLTVGKTYTFEVKARDGLFNETTKSPQASVTVSGQGSNILTVPVPYHTIQEAINASSNGDIVEVRPGTYRGTGNRDLDFVGKAITVRSIDPSDPAVVVGTIIDVEEAAHFLQGMPFTSHRAFIFFRGESSSSIVAGFTIMNGMQYSQQPTATPPGSGNAGGNGQPNTGGAIRCVFSSRPTIRDCFITNCFVLGGRGGNGASGFPGDPTAVPPLPIITGGRGGNGGTGMGGGIYCDNTSSPIISNCTINGCIVLGGYGGNGGNGEEVPDPNAADGRGGSGGNGGNGLGGGIYLDTSSNAIVSNCTIINCQALMGRGGAGGGGSLIWGNPGNNGYGFGGGEYYGRYTVSMIGTRIRANDADSNGGGIFCGGQSNFTLIGCDISDNNCTYGSGGGIWYDTGGTVTLHDCNLSNNIVHSDGYGGGMRAGSTTGITNIIIDDNSVITGNAAGYGGGGLLLLDVNLTLNNSIIGDNNAPEGAGVWAYNSIVCVNSCMVWGNSAADLGGGFSFINGLVTINNSFLTGNKTAGTGGALFFEGWSNNPHKITNCLITDNEAFSDGGGLSNNIGSWIQVTNCTFAGNEATGSYGVGGGISCAEYWAYLEILNSILWGNEALGGGSQIAVGDPEGSSPSGPNASVDVNHTDVQGGAEGVWLEDESQEYTALWWLDGSIDEDPLFVSTSVVEQTYFLSQIASGQLENSPCVDAGLGNASDLESIIGVPLSTRTDLIADADTNNIVDMGYHYSVVPGAPMPKYRLTIEVVNQGYGTFGTVLPPWEPGIYDVNYGVVVELHAEPNADWEVYRWTGTDYVPVYPADPNFNKVTMNADKTVTVEFGPRNAYKLITHVIGNGAIEPVGLTIWPPGAVVPLTATPANPSEVIIWTGTDDDFSGLRHNTVTMNEHKEVFVEFYAPRTLYVPAAYPTIQAAIDDSHDRDIITIGSAPQPYYTSLGFTIDSKNITITSTNPDDPCCVANTIIERDVCEPALNIGPIFTFYNVGHNMVLNGLTIRGFVDYGGTGVDGLQCGDPGNDGGWLAGGGISCGDFSGYGNASPTIRNCMITECNLLGGNGGTGFDGCPEHPEGGEGGWPGRAYGAASACFYGSSPVYINCTFQNNVARGGNGGDGGNGNGTPPGPWGPGGPGGGWYYGIGNRWYGHDWPFGPYDLYTTYSGRGGAMYVGSGCSPEFINCTFTNNRSFGGSNGICGLDGAPVLARYEPSIRWKIDNFGGAVYVAGNSTARFTDCAFNDNLADTDNLPDSSDLFVSFGGAIAFEEGSDLTFDNCTFNGNLATIGGGIYSRASDPQINDCNFTGNSALHGGGALFVFGTVNIKGSDFSENEATATAGEGGGMCCLGVNAGIIDCNITNNDTNGSGGGIYFSNKDISGQEIPGGNTILVKNCLLTGNYASRDGGGISTNWHSDPNIVNCTIADNVVTGAGFEAGYGGGVFCSYGSYAKIINSIIWDNYGQRGPQLAIGTGFEYYPLPSTVNITYSDVKGGQSFVFTDTDCNLVWDVDPCHPDYPTNKHINPLFVTGPLGDYYLSQIAAGQSPPDSPCVDTGSGSAENLGMNKYTTRTDEKPDRETVDMGYHYPFTPEAQPCRFCELFRDGIINFKDYAVFILNWLSEDCNPANDWCQHSDITFDTSVDYKDVDFLAECWLAGDTYPPTPNPSEWEVVPYPSWSAAHPNSISMVAKTASDAWDFWVGNVQYYFDCVYGDCNDSGWQNEPNYTNSNLVVGFEYGYRVRAKDQKCIDHHDGTPNGDCNCIDPEDPNAPNKTGWSLTCYAIAGEEPPIPEDHTPPTPDPMTWATVPNAASSTSITMVASTATDNNAGVQYYFEDVNTLRGVNSGWQSEETWTDTACVPQTTYTYRVKARDTSTWYNETGWSVPLSATTPAPPLPVDTIPPLPDPSQWAVNGEPVMYYSNGYWWHSMTAEPASDATTGNSEPVQYFFELVNGGYGPHSSGWQLSNVYTYQVSTLNPQFGYYRVKTRDAAGVETGYSSTLETQQ